MNKNVYFYSTLNRTMLIPARILRPTLLHISLYVKHRHSSLCFPVHNWPVTLPDNTSFCSAGTNQPFPFICLTDILTPHSEPLLFTHPLFISHPRNALHDQGITSKCRYHSYTTYEHLLSQANRKREKSSDLTILVNRKSDCKLS